MTDRGQRGFTIVELMVGLVLLSLVVAMTLQLALTMIEGFRAQRSGYTVERNARAAADYLAEAIRSGSIGTSTGDLRDVAGCTPVAGLDVTNSTGAPDQLTVIYASGGVVTSLRSAVDGDTTTFDIADPTSIATGDSLVLTDGNIGRLVRLEQLSSAGQATIASPESTCSWIPMPTFAPGTLVVRARVARFYVEPQNNVPYLMMDPDGEGPAAAEPLAEGIEDLQIAIGVDLDGDGEIEEFGNAPDDDEWFYNVAGDAAPPAITNGQWRAARVTVVARDARAAHASIGSTRPAAEDRAAATAGDVYRRRVLTTMAEIRNLGFQQ